MNLFNPLRFGGISAHGVVLIEKRESYVIFLLFGSDGAGGYVASFIFKNGKYIRMIVEQVC